MIAGIALAKRLIMLHATNHPLPHDLWRVWTFAPALLAGLAFGAVLYATGLRSVWSRGRRGRVVAPWRACCFAGALLALFVALVSPVDAAGSALFSAHMLQHLLLVMVAAPLMALGEPLTVTLWALPVRWRRRVARSWRRATGLRALWSALSVPAAAWTLHVATLWIWHAPYSYERALRDERIHILEHASFFATAVLFWWLLTRQHGRRMSVGLAIAYLFAAALQSTILGALIALARHPWYPAHLGTTTPWGLTPLEDQQLAGLLMWVPAGVIYLVPLVALVTRALAGGEIAMHLQGAVRPSAAGVSARGTP